MITAKIKPAPDSHYRLLPCNCGGEPLYHHLEYDFTDVDYWRVVCPVCGRQTTDFHARHDAQIDWNTDMQREEVK